MWELESPIYVMLPRKRTDDVKHYLNLNVYRNTNFYTLNEAKVIYKESMLPLLNTLPKLNHISITYTLYTGSKRKCDIANICCVVDKFFCDALVEAGRIPDDNYDFISNITYAYGSVSANNPHVKITIKEI